MKIIMGGDARSFDAKNYVRDALIKKGYEVFDVDPDTPDRFDINALKVVRGVQSGEYDRGICFCMTGMGVSIVCNKFRGIYAALCHGVYDAKRARIYNNTNVLVMGGGFVGPVLAEQIALTWLQTEHLEGIPDQWKEKSKFDFQALLQVEKLAYGDPDAEDPV